MSNLFPSLLIDWMGGQINLRHSSSWTKGNADSRFFAILNFICTLINEKLLNFRGSKDRDGEKNLITVQNRDDRLPPEKVEFKLHRVVCSSPFGWGPRRCSFSSPHYYYRFRSNAIKAGWVIRCSSAKNLWPFCLHCCFQFAIQKLQDAFERESAPMRSRDISNDIRYFKLRICVGLVQLSPCKTAKKVQMYCNFEWHNVNLGRRWQLVSFLPCCFCSEFPQEFFILRRPCPLSLGQAWPPPAVFALNSSLVRWMAVSRLGPFSRWAFLTLSNAASMISVQQRVLSSSSSSYRGRCCPCLEATEPSLLSLFPIASSYSLLLHSPTWLL